MESFSVLAYVGAWAATTSGMWLLFEKAEQKTKPEIRQAASLWIQPINTRSAIANWTEQFSGVLDSIFGEHHLSWRFFWRSCIASLISTLTLLLGWLALYGAGSVELLTQTDESTAKVIFLLTVSYTLAIFLNFFPDYLSLLETRYLLDWLRLRESPGRFLLFLCLDIVLTITAFLGVLFIVGSFLERRLPDFAFLLEQALLPTSSKASGNPLVIYCYSTFFSSVWLWTYVVSGLVVRVFRGSGIRKVFLTRVLDSEHEPFRVLGWIAIILVTLAFLFLPVVQLTRTILS